MKFTCNWPVNKNGSLKVLLVNMVLITSTFVWYFYAFDMLTQSVKQINPEYVELLAIWSSHFGAAVISAFLGANISIKIEKKMHFLYGWSLLEFFASFSNFLLNNPNLLSLLFISSFIGASFGLGMPVCMGYFRNSTFLEERARLGGLIFFSNGPWYLLLGITNVWDVTSKTLILASWRGLWLLALILLKPSEQVIYKSKELSYIEIIRTRDFTLYYIPWWMLCLVNYLNVPTLIKSFGEAFYRFSTLIEGVLAGFFSIIGGYLSDINGRKRTVILGFTMLGLGYATLGLYPKSLVSWWFYTIVDGVAWGFFYVLFLLTIWGELAHHALCEKYYALGGLPFFLSNYLKIMIAPYISGIFSVYTVFSLASFFLFLAVIPLMYAPETLPERKLRERELRSYIERAKRIREKFTKGQ